MNKHSTQRSEPTFSTQQSTASSNSQYLTATVVWYDSNMNSDSDCKQTKSMLWKISDKVRLYILKDEFLNHIETTNDTSIILILSGHAAQDILPKVHDYKSIRFIHIYRCENSLHQPLKSAFRKIKSISNDRNELKVMVEKILKHYVVSSFYENVSQTSTWDLTTRTADFLWFQPLQNTILSEEVAKTEEAKCDFIQRCREYRGDNYQADQMYIDYLENDYRSKDAIQEYAKTNFLHLLINQALRTGDIEELYRFRYYLYQLCRQLRIRSKLFRRRQKKLKKTVLTLYRGQQLSRDEGERLRTSGNKYIAMRSFISTTRARDAAEFFAGTSSDRLAVLFEITIDLNQVPSMILADITEFSEISSEEEILFSLNATFEIDEILVKSDHWIIRMHATNLEHEIANDYIRCRQSEISNYSSLSLISMNFKLAELLIEMGQYDQAVKILEKTLPTTDDERANRLFILADAKISSHHTIEHALDEGIRLLKESEELFTSLNNKSALANARRRRADALVLNEQYDEASRIYQQALELYKQIPNQQENIANCKNGLGDVYLAQRNYTKAENDYRTVLKWRRTHLPNEHPAIARSLYSLGRYFYCIGNNNPNALLLLKAALERQKKIYPSDHPSIKCSEYLLQKLKPTCTR